MILKLNAEPFIFSAVELAGTAPTEFQLLPLGKWEGYRHPVSRELIPFEVNEADVAAAVAFNATRQQRGGKRDLVIDYEHQTVLTAGPAPAAGWIGALENRGRDGLWAKDVRWTAKGKKHIEDGEYRYISPVFKHNATDKVTGRSVRMAVFNAGITNEPFLDELPPLINKDRSHRLYYFTSPHIQQEDTMDKVLQFITTFLALAAGATHDEVVAKANTFIEQLRGLGIVAKEGAVLTAQTVLDQVTALKGDLTKARANYALVAKALGEKEDALPEKLTALIAASKDTTGYVAKAEFDTLKAQLEERDVREYLVANANKVTAAIFDQMLALGKKDFTALKGLVEKMPVVVNTSKITGQAPERGEELSDTDLLVAKQMGVDPKLLKAQTN